MKIIEVKIKISDIDRWDVDWTDKQQIANYLEEFNNEIRDVVARGYGISFTNIKVKSKLTEQ